MSGTLTATMTGTQTAVMTVMMRRTAKRDMALIITLAKEINMGFIKTKKTSHKNIIRIKAINKSPELLINAVPAYRGGFLLCHYYPEHVGVSSYFYPMADVHDKATRSYNMSQIRSRNTKPEMLVRKFLHAQGFRYKLHD